MTDQTIQIALSVGVPTVAVLVGVLINSSRLSDLRAHIDARFDAVNQRFDEADASLKHVKER